MTTRHHFICLTVLVTTMLLPLSSHGSSEEKAPEKQQVQTLLVPYVPPSPLRPTPKIRTSQGGTRGCGGLPTVTLLAPEHVALTTQEQPQLYWHISAATRKPMVFTLGSDDAVQPLLEWRLPESVSSGVHSVYLAEHDVHLEIGITYEWSLRMLCEQGETGSGDLVVKSYIERILSGDQPGSTEKNDDLLVRAKGYADSGIWYDAVATLYEAWIKKSGDKSLKDAWIGMLRQVDLPQPKP